ncbi:MAG: Fis family transcriptional regulator [Halomonas sp.]|nr:SoxR reducing system RseC family protein [Halomonas sp.]TVP43289.1 MAG: Fis family transcriptional regulator [Halomonas sp.]
MTSPNPCGSLLRTGSVVDYTPDGLIVEIATQEGCEQCAQGRGCGVGLLARRRRQRIIVTSSFMPSLMKQHYPLGSSVVVSLPRASITLLAFCIYALPLLIAMLLSGLASYANDPVWLAPLVFFAALAGGALSVKYLLRGQIERFRPRLVN